MVRSAFEQPETTRDNHQRLRETIRYDRGMPRRPRRLDPAEGIKSQFALELRALRDRAGADAPSVDKIANSQRAVGRAAMFKALSGTCIPSLKVLEAMVVAWGGDLPEWIQKRAAAEIVAGEEVARRARVQAHNERKNTLASSGVGSSPETGAQGPGTGRGSNLDAWSIAKPTVAARLAEVRSRRAALDSPTSATGLNPSDNDHLADLKIVLDAESARLELADMLEGLRTKEAGNAKKLSVRQISDRITDYDLPKVTPSTVFNALEGEHFPSKNTFMSIGLALGGDSLTLSKKWDEVRRLYNLRSQIVHGAWRR